MRKLLLFLTYFSVSNALEYTCSVKNSTKEEVAVSLAASGGFTDNKIFKAGEVWNPDVGSTCIQEVRVKGLSGAIKGIVQQKPTPLLSNCRDHSVEVYTYFNATKPLTLDLSIY